MALTVKSLRRRSSSKESVNKTASGPVIRVRNIFSESGYFITVLRKNKLQRAVVYALCFNIEAFENAQEFVGLGGS